MKKKNILVFLCGSEIGLDIYNSVKNIRYFNLYGGSSINDHGKFVYENYIGNFPYITDQKFIPFLKNVIEKYHIDAIYPAMDLCLDILKKIENEIHCKVITSPFETTSICLSKQKTYEKLKNIINVPKIYTLNNIDFPCFGKPKIGYGAIGTKKINTIIQASEYIKDKSKMLVQYLPGDEYTIDCFTDKDGKLLISLARKRNRIKNGISVNTFFVKDQSQFNDIAQKINDILKFRGAWFFQLKRNKNNQLCLLEVAARLGGSSNLSKGIGINFALLSLFDIFDYPINILKNEYNIELDRSLNNVYKIDYEYNNVYVDFDDCLIIDNKVNLQLISFLYKCLNQNKNIFLISKHKTDIYEDLLKFKIDKNIFTNIFVIAQNDQKYNYIQKEKSIFIDDSFKERSNVKNKLNIPVFGIDMIQVLL